MAEKTFRFYDVMLSRLDDEGFVNYLFRDAHQKLEDKPAQNKRISSKVNRNHMFPLSVFKVNPGLKIAPHSCNSNYSVE